MIDIADYMEEVVEINDDQADKIEGLTVIQPHGVPTLSVPLSEAADLQLRIVQGGNQTLVTTVLVEEDAFRLSEFLIDFDSFKANEDFIGPVVTLLRIKSAIPVARRAMEGDF